MSLAGDAARGAATTLVGQSLRFALHVLSLAILARLLSPADYGVLSMVLALAGIATVLGDFGLSLASIQSRTLTAGQRSNLFWINLALGIVLAGLVYLAAEPVALFYGQPELADVTRAISLVFLLNAAVAQFRAEATRSLRFVGLAITDVATQAIALLVAIAAALAGWGYWALVLQQVALAASTLIALTIVARWLPGPPRRGESMRPLIGFGANTVGVQLINYASANIDSIVLGRFWGPTALGYYDRAYQLFRLPLQQIAAPMTRVALPVLSRLQGTDAYDRYLERSQLLVAYTFGGVFFAAAALAEPMIFTVLGPKWEPTIPLFRVLAIGGLFQALGYVYYWVFLSKAKTGMQLRFTIGTRSLMIVLIGVGSIFGPFGVTVAVASGLAINWLILTVFAMPRVGVRVGRLVALTVRPGLLYLSMLLAVWGLTIAMASIPPWMTLIVGGFAAVAFCGLGVALIPALRRDVLEIWDTIRRLRS